MYTENFKVYSRGIIQNKEGKILLVEKNNTRKIAPWKALFPGWTLEFWEEIENSLIREIQEEVDLDVISLHLFWTQKIMLDWVHWLWVYYICETKDFDFHNNEPEKHTRVFWWDYNDLDEYGKKILDSVK